MVEFARDAILTLTLLACVHLFANLHVTKRADGAQYCIITYRAAGRDQAGNLIQGWARGYGLCSLLDRYEIA